MKIDLLRTINQSKDLKLLYVEDNQDAREMTTLILETFFEDITIAKDGKEALELYNNKSFDLIITDLLMPNLDGLELCKLIREKDNDISLVILTAHNEEKFFLDSIDIGINGYLIKPIDFEKLAKLIYRITTKHKFLKDARKNLHLLKEYQEATDLACIVSKTDPRGIITYVNETFCQISGYSKEELIGKNHNIIRHPDNPKEIFKEMWHTIKKEKKPWKGIVRNLAKNKKSYYADSLVKPILDENGKILEYISLRHDVTEIMNPQRQLMDAIKNAKKPIIVLIKLETYEIVEDFFNSEKLNRVENEFLAILEKRFSNYFEFDKIYSLKNGEFAFILEHERYIDCIAKFLIDLQRIQNEFLDSKFSIDDFYIETSIILSIAYDGKNMLESAKIGVKRAIQERKSFIIANDLSQAEFESAKNNLKTISKIKYAINNDKILSFFQPIVDNKSKKVVKYESLIRLVDEKGNTLSPFFFLEVAKKTTYYPKIVDLILENSFKMLKHSDAEVSINLSTIDIDQRDIRLKVLKLLESYKKETKRIVFELLEDEDVRDIENLKVFIKKVKRYGVKIAIDDFGSGYSNYQRLSDFQPDILKIDGSLIKNIDKDMYAYSVVKSILTFAKEQKMQTVAEFVENESIFRVVKELGIDFSQGYYFGKPEKYV